MGEEDARGSGWAVVRGVKGERGELRVEELRVEEGLGEDEVCGGRDVHAVILHFAIQSEAGGGEVCGGAEPESGDRVAEGGVGRDGEGKQIGAGLERHGGEHLLIGLRPAALVVEIDPRAELAVRGGDDFEAGGLAKVQRAGETNAIFIIYASGIVARGGGCGLPVGFCVDQVS